MAGDIQIRQGKTIRLDLGNRVPVPVRDYLMLVNKPMINGVELVGDLILKLSDFENDPGFLTQETDPTVPQWAKQPDKPSYTASEVGALSIDTFIPKKVSDLQNDRGFYIKPNGGIPLSDMAPGVIPDFSSKLDASLKGARGGVAELDQNGMVPSHQLPSYVDDVKSYPSISFFPAIGEDDKIYVDKSTNKQYRWSGDIEVGYVPIASSLALGETAQSAYRGDRGKIAYDHAIAKGQAYESGLYKVTTNAEGHVVLAVSVTKEDITALGIPGSQPDISGLYTKPIDGIPASDLAAGVIPDVSGFYTKPVSGIPASDLAAGVIPTVPVTDVQIDGTSILNNGVANIPVGNGSTYGVYKAGYGLLVNMGSLQVQSAGDSNIKAGNVDYYSIVPYRQHKAVYYGLSKLAGEDLKNASGETVGVYPDASKQAIQKLFGFDGIFGTYQTGITASKAYAIGETFIMDGKRYKVTADISDGGLITVGTNCELAPITLSDIQLNGSSIIQNGIATIPLADTNGHHGIMKCNNTGSYGIGITTDSGTTSEIRIRKATDNELKAGTQQYKPIVPYNQHVSVFYATAKAAGDSTQASSSNPVGQYTDAAKTAILAMYGITLSGDQAAQEVIAAYTNPGIRTSAAGVSF